MAHRHQCIVKKPYCRTVIAHGTTDGEIARCVSSSRNTVIDLAFGRGCRAKRGGSERERIRLRAGASQSARGFA